MERVWGLTHSDKLDENLVNNLSEAEMWRTIEYLGCLFFDAMHDDRFPGGTAVPIEELKDIQEDLEYCVYQTNRFGVEFDEYPTSDKHVVRTDSYQDWYNFWKKHFDSLSYDQIEDYVDRNSKHEDVSDLMPKLSWSESKQIRGK